MLGRLLATAWAVTTGVAFAKPYGIALPEPDGFPNDTAEKVYRTLVPSYLRAGELTREKILQLAGDAQRRMTGDGNNGA
jgi:hypothetical protein